MNRKYLYLALAAASSVAVAVVSAPASAASVAAEARFADLKDGRDNLTEYRVQLDDKIGVVNYGLELQTFQGQNDGDVSSLISGKIGTDLKAPLGFTVKPVVEAGYALRTGDNFEFWGAGATVSRPIFGVVSGEVGYRHRQAFDGSNGFNEERLHAGVEVALSSKYSVTGAYYRTRGTLDTDVLGVGAVIKF